MERDEDEQRDRSCDRNEIATSDDIESQPSDVPLELHVGAPGARGDLEVVAVLAEKVVWCEELAPGRHADKDLVDNFGSCSGAPSTISAPRAEKTARDVNDAPRLNSAVMMLCVLSVTLCVEHMEG